MAGKEEKKAFVLRMNPQTLKALEKWAADEFRSVNGQIEYLLLRSLRDAGREPKATGKKDREE
jgi:hypothetical protein